MEIPPKSPQEGEKKIYKVAIVDNSQQVDSAARDAADSELTASEKELTGVKGFFKKFWTHNIAKPYYLQKETLAAKARILESGNAYINEGGKQDHYEREKAAIVERFLSEYDETLHKDAGEQREVFGKNEKELVIQSKIKDLIVRFANDEIAEEEFVAEKIRVFNEIKGDSKGIFEKGLMYCDNVFEIAKEIKGGMDHKKGLTALDFDFEVVIGRAKSGARTEAQYNSVDRLTAKVMDSKIGSLVNETTVASAISIMSTISAAASKVGLNSKLAAFGTFGLTALAGGGIAALRERKMLEDDRKQHFREMAQGKKFDDAKSQRRKEMEEYRYETRDANSLFQNLDKSLYSYDEEGKQELKKDLSFAEFQVAFGELAEIEARIAISDTKKIDLISYSDVKEVEQERLLLDLARAKAKVDLRKFAYNPAMQQILNGQDVDTFLKSATQTRTRQLTEGTEGEKGIEHQNKLFADCKTKATAKAFVKGVATGLAVGAAVQEVLAFFNPNQTGLVENFLFRDANGAVDANGMPIHDATANHFTPLEYVRRWFMDNGTGNEFPLMAGPMHDEVIGSMHVKLPDGVHFSAPDADGHFSLMHGNEKLADHLTLDNNGNISEKAKLLLHENGINIKDNLGYGTSQEYIQSHPGSTHHVHRDLWYDNNTPKPIFDKNELKLLWGGHQGTGIDSHGNYVFNVKQMMEDGSYHSNLSVDAQEAIKNGKLEMIFSASGDTQSDVFKVAIDANGNASIDPDSEIGKMLFKEVDGHAKFLGKYAEVAQNMGTGNDEAEHVRILATHVGNGLKEVAAPVPIMEIPAPYEIDGPWVFPAAPRTPLEKINEIHSYLNGYFEEDKKNIIFYRERRSKSLENPNVKLDQNKEIIDYLKRQGDGWNSKLDEMNKQINISMQKSCKLAVCIPAAGHQEGKNIFKTLSQYKYQKNAKGKLLEPNLFEILVFVNHPKDSDPDETLNEIKRFEAENPYMNVRVVYEKLDRNEAKIGNIRKYITDLALFRGIQRTDNKNDLIIVSNDADCKGMSENYISNFLDEFEKHKNVDAMLGKIDWDNEAYEKSPLLHMGTRFFQYLDAAYRHHKNRIEKSVGSSGANFAFKSSIYAAVGGYMKDDRIAEDRHLGTMIKNARRGSSVYPVEYAGIKSYIYTSARRAVDALKKGLSPAEQWGTDFGPDDELRKMDWDIDESEKDFDNVKYQEKLRSGLERFINRTLKVYNLQANSWAATKAMRFMGVKYKIEKKYDKSQVFITDITKLVKGLREYKNKK